MTEGLPDCDCGANSWSQFYNKKHETGRRVRKFECDVCGAEGRKFSGGGGSTIYTGAMRE